VTPSQALSGLHAALAEHGIRTVGMDFGRLDGTLIQDSGDAVVYSCGLFWWPTGRLRRGRPVYAVHAAADPHGAARRIARTRMAPAMSQTARRASRPRVAPAPFRMGGMAPDVPG
jgi:hypothetical protein